MGQKEIRLVGKFAVEPAFQYRGYISICEVCTRSGGNARRQFARADTQSNSTMAAKPSRVGTPCPRGHSIIGGQLVAHPTINGFDFPFPSSATEQRRLVKGCRRGLF